MVQSPFIASIIAACSFLSSAEHFLFSCWHSKTTYSIYIALDLILFNESVSQRHLPESEPQHTPCMESLKEIATVTNTFPSANEAQEPSHTTQSNVSVLAYQKKYQITQIYSLQIYKSITSLLSSSGICSRMNSLYMQLKLKTDRSHITLSYRL